MNNGNEEKLKLAAAKIELRTRHLAFWTASVVLISTSITTLTIVFSYQDVKALISRTVEKPFEGEWGYRSQYEKYYDEPSPHELYGEGSAIVLWKYSKNRYEVNLSYDIHRLENQNPILVNVFKGELAADANGWPVQQPFVMDNKLLHRLHYQNKVHNLPVYQFKDCTYMKSASGARPEKINCILETPHSRSKVTFIWEAGIH